MKHLPLIRPADESDAMLLVFFEWEIAIRSSVLYARG